MAFALCRAERRSAWGQRRWPLEIVHFSRGAGWGESAIRKLKIGTL
jgi:hypothetical protein